MEGILHLPCRMVLGLEQSIEVPERALHNISFYFSEAHFQEDLAHLIDKALVRMYLGSINRTRRRMNIIRSEVFLFPFSTPEHLGSDLGDLFLDSYALKH